MTEAALKAAQVLRSPASSTASTTPGRTRGGPSSRACHPKPSERTALLAAYGAVDEDVLSAQLRLHALYGAVWRAHHAPPPSRGRDTTTGAVTRFDEEQATRTN